MEQFIDTTIILERTLICRRVVNRDIFNSDNGAVLERDPSKLLGVD